MTPPNLILSTTFNRDGKVTTIIQNPSPRVHSLMSNLCTSYGENNDGTTLTYREHKDIGLLHEMEQLFTDLDEVE